MYKKDKITCSLIFFAVAITAYYFEAPLNGVLIQNLGTLFSILFGFYIAALSVLYGSAYSKRLYDRIDGEIPTQTQLHTLKKYFQASSSAAIISLIMIIVTSLVSDNSAVGVMTPQLPTWDFHFLKSFWISIQTGLVWSALLLSMTSANLYLALRLLKVLLAGFVEEAKNKG